MDKIDPHPGLGFSSPDGTRFDGAGLVEASQNFADASMRDEELARDVAWPNSKKSKLHNPSAHRVRQRSAIDKDASELVHAGLSWNQTGSASWASDRRRIRLHFSLEKEALQLWGYNFACDEYANMELICMIYDSHYLRVNVIVCCPHFTSCFGSPEIGMNIDSTRSTCSAFMKYIQ